MGLCTTTTTKRVAEHQLRIPIAAAITNKDKLILYKGATPKNDVCDKNRQQKTPSAAIKKTSTRQTKDERSRQQHNPNRGRNVVVVSKNLHNKKHRLNVALTNQYKESTQTPSFKHPLHCYPSLKHSMHCSPSVSPPPNLLGSNSLPPLLAYNLHPPHSFNACIGPNLQVVVATVIHEPKHYGEAVKKDHMGSTPGGHIKLAKADSTPKQRQSILEPNSGAQETSHCILRRTQPKEKRRRKDHSKSPRAVSPTEEQQ